MRQCLLLELDRAPGLQAVLLNQKTLTAISPARSYYLIPLPEIEERNTLVLEVDTGKSGDGPTGPGPDWGQIALLIRPIDRGARPVNLLSARLVSRESPRVPARGPAPWRPRRDVIR